jgi:hypothetical protein
VWIGRWQPSGDGRVFNGNISNVQIYDTALSPQQILQNYNTQKLRFGYYDSVQDGLSLNLDTTNYLSYPRSGTTWTDLTGKGNNGTLTNGATFSGGTTPSIVFDGSDDYVSCNSGLINNSDFSVSFWIKYQDIISASSRGLISTWDTSWNGFGIATQSGGFIRSWTNNGAGGGMNWELSSTIKDVWVNITLTYTFSTKTQRGYINSVFKISENFGSNITHGTLQIARGGPTGSSQLSNYPNTNCLISDVQLYNKVLTPQEIIQNFESQRVDYGITGITTNGLVLNLDSANNASYNGSGSTWVDISGSGTDGILTNGPTYVSSGASSSISFDGSDDFVIVGNPESLRFNNATFSYGCWFYWSNTNTLATLMGKRDGNNTVNVPSGSGYNQWGLTIADSMCCGPAGKNLGNCIISDGGSGGGCNISAPLPNYAGWLYGFITVNTTEQKLYINGVLSATTNNDLTNKTFNIVGRSFYVGATGGELEGSIISPFNNKISSAQVYNRTLSASEVLQNYNATKSRFGL